LFSAIGELASVGEKATSGDYGLPEPKARVQPTRFGRGGGATEKYSYNHEEAKEAMMEIKEALLEGDRFAQSQAQKLNTTNPSSADVATATVYTKFKGIQIPPTAEKVLRKTMADPNASQEEIAVAKKVLSGKVSRKDAIMAKNAKSGRIPSGMLSDDDLEEASNLRYLNDLMKQKGQDVESFKRLDFESRDEIVLRGVATERVNEFIKLHELEAFVDAENIGTRRNPSTRVRPRKLMRHEVEDLDVPDHYYVKELDAEEGRMVTLKCIFDEQFDNEDHVYAFLHSLELLDNGKEKYNVISMRDENKEVFWCIEDVNASDDDEAGDVRRRR
jgi:hypothetical protein